MSAENNPSPRVHPGSINGKLYRVSVGPGCRELIPPLAETASRSSDAIVGYDLYLRWITPWIAGKDIHTLPLTKERERAARAIETAHAETDSWSRAIGGGERGSGALQIELGKKLADIPIGRRPAGAVGDASVRNIGQSVGRDVLR